jgi:hypothetical protein
MSKQEQKGKKQQSYYSSAQLAAIAPFVARALSAPVPKLAVRVPVLDEPRVRVGVELPAILLLDARIPRLQPSGWLRVRHLNLLSHRFGWRVGGDRGGMGLAYLKHLGPHCLARPSRSLLLALSHTRRCWYALRT